VGKQPSQALAETIVRNLQQQLSRFFFRAEVSGETSFSASSARTIPPLRIVGNVDAHPKFQYLTPGCGGIYFLLLNLKRTM
jgi:hypothetical protein